MGLFYIYNLIMGYIRHNENPCDIRTIDCTVRALAAILNETWNSIYIQLCVTGYDMCDMPSSKAVISRFLKSKGFTCHVIEDSEKVAHFAEIHPRGRYLLATNTHVVPVIDGDYIDTWDSGQEIPLFYWKRGN